MALSQLVFVGEVLTVDAVNVDPVFVYRVRIRVREAFKGTSTGERVFDFGTRQTIFGSWAGNGSSCMPVATSGLIGSAPLAA